MAKRLRRARHRSLAKISALPSALCVATAPPLWHLATSDLSGRLSSASEPLLLRRAGKWSQHPYRLSYVFGNDRPSDIDERWEWSELKMLIYARSSDPRTGIVEYRLTIMRRAEPPAELFVIPSDYP
jgi:hypothetical protein